MGEAKASGNLGNTLKMLGRFEDAIKFCEKHLLISKAENDKVNQTELKIFACAKAAYVSTTLYSVKNCDEFVLRRSSDFTDSKWTA